MRVSIDASLDAFDDLGEAPGIDDQFEDHGFAGLVSDDQHLHSAS